MARKLILLITILLLTLSACLPAETPTAAFVPATDAPAEEIADPAPEEPTSAPEIVEEPTATPVAEPTEEPTPYPEPEAEVEVDEPITGAAAEPYPGPEEVEWPLTITDDLGNTIQLDAYPQSIVSISPSMTEILFAIGAGDQLVGRDELSMYPEAALDVASVGNLWNGVPTEAILALEPDLVVAAEIISEENVQVLLDLGLPVYWQANPADFDGLYENLLDIAEITGHTDETLTLISDLQARVDIVVTTLADAQDAPAVFYELDATDPANPWTIGSGTFIDYIITMAGGLNAASTLAGDYIQISAEELIVVNPEIILLADALYGVTPESVTERPGWDAILAVQNGAIYPIDPNMMSVPGPRLVDALEEAAQLIHPELFD